jgi:hypothetical protein
MLDKKASDMTTAALHLLSTLLSTALQYLPDDLLAKSNDLAKFFITQM